MENKTVLQIISKVHCCDEWADSPERAVINLTQEQIENILALGKKVKELKQSNSNIYQITSWSGDPIFINSDADEHPEVYNQSIGEDVLDTIFNKAEDIVDINKLPGAESDNFVASVDTIILINSDYSFHYHGYLKHTDVLIETEDIEYAELEKQMQLSIQQ